MGQSVSGGGIWRLSDNSKPVNGWEPDDVRLVAIDNSWRREQRYVRGTNVAVALALIYGAYESLRLALEMEYPHLRSA